SEHGTTKVSEVSLRQVFGGARGVIMMFWETSLLDPQQGIRFRGYSIPQLRKKLPTGNGDEPLPEGLFWLLMTGSIPTEEEVKWVSREWRKRSEVPPQTFKVIDFFPPETHPMTQFVTAIASMSTESHFSRRYAEGLSKADYWDAAYEDTMDLIAKLPRVAAYIYRRSFHNADHIEPSPRLDWAANFAHMLGVSKKKDFKTLMRLYMTIHADHEGGNASAHTMHLINSTLADPYLSFSGAMCSLAGPLHGLANQEVIKWIFEMIEKLGTTRPTNEQIAQYVHDTLAAGKVIPGYGHAVLRRPDPRFMAQMGFAERNIKNDDIVNIVWQIYKVVPPILKGLGKVKNPWPNVDAHSGALLTHYGLREYSYYTVLFGVSRALGVLASSCWSRALGLPLERPKSVNLKWIKDYLKDK
ncbi:MAG TPA: citrate (Si)-synthase, partial [Bacteroidetes bacterium]|nr:citrate (Si)-synthase [Bacteroidota bacterium]